MSDDGDTTILQRVKVAAKKHTRKGAIGGGIAATLLAGYTADHEVRELHATKEDVAATKMEVKMSREIDAAAWIVLQDRIKSMETTLGNLREEVGKIDGKLSNKK